MAATNPARDAYKERLEQRRNPPAMIAELLRAYFPPEPTRAPQQTPVTHSAATGPAQQLAFDFTPVAAATPEPPATPGLFALSSEHGAQTRTQGGAP